MTISSLNAKQRNPRLHAGGAFLVGPTPLRKRSGRCKQRERLSFQHFAQVSRSAPVLNGYARLRFSWLTPTRQQSFSVGYFVATG
jgi:hypothetical protein